MSDVLTVLMWMLVLGALIQLHMAFWGRFFSVRRMGDQVYFVTTQDGWQIAVHRYVAREQKFKEPVLLCHGIGANRFQFDLTDDRSLVRHLNERGFDVWQVELRGTGLSTRPRVNSPYRASYGFEHYLQQDIPAALSLVREITVSAGVFWVGHSLGGLLGYAWLGLRKQPGLFGLVTISAPVRSSESVVLRRLRPLVGILALARVVAFRPLARFFSPFLGWSWLPMTRLVSVKLGMEGALVRRCLVNLTENTTGAVLRQLLGWVRSGEFKSRSQEQEEDYLSNLARIQEPVLIVASDADRIAPPKAVVSAYGHIGSEDKQLRVFGTDRGDDYDFGHADLLLGQHAPQQVYPEIADWLEAHASPSG